MVNEQRLSYTYFFSCSDLVKGSVSNVTEASPVPELEVHQDPNHLHRLVSEGDVTGVRLVSQFLLLEPSYTKILFLSLHLFSLYLLYRDFLAKAATENESNYMSSLLEAQNADGQTALHLACRRGSAELVETILEYEEANVDVLDKDGDPPLVFALAAGSHECVRSLIKRNASVKSRLRDGLGPSVAHVCAYHGQPDCMRVRFP
jgi:E3 ubiquitin-protein ligase KEG